MAEISNAEYLNILKEVVIQKIIEPKRIKNHMGKKSFRALKQFNAAVTSGQVINAERAAVELGLDANQIRNINVLLER